MKEWVKQHILSSLNSMKRLKYATPSGIGPLTFQQAYTLTEIIVWASKHDDCNITKDEAKDLCKAIQNLTITRSKEEAKDD